MNRLPPLAALLLLASCNNGGRYENNDLELVTQYTAREVCSCLFVMEQSEEFCRAWTKANPTIAKFTVDADKKTVSASALTLWGGRARFVNARSGCVVE